MIIFFDIDKLKDLSFYKLYKGGIKCQSKDMTLVVGPLKMI